MISLLRKSDLELEKIFKLLMNWGLVLNKQSFFDNCISKYIMIIFHLLFVVLTRI